MIGFDSDLVLERFYFHTLGIPLNRLWLRRTSKPNFTIYYIYQSAVVDPIGEKILAVYPKASKSIERIIP